MSTSSSSRCDATRPIVARLVGGDDRPEPLGARDGHPVDRGDDVARLHAGGGCGAARLTSATATPPVQFDADTEERMLRLARRDQPRGDGLDRVGRDANPTPSLPPESLWICELMPITCPARSTAGRRSSVVDRGVRLDRASIGFVGGGISG